MALALHIYSYITFLSNSYAFWRGHLYNLKQSQAFVASSSRQELQSVLFPDEATSCQEFSEACDNGTRDQWGKHNRDAIQVMPVTHRGILSDAFSL